MITATALDIAENSLAVSRNVNRQYDDSFAQTGAKIGSTLRIRLPTRSVVAKGAALAVQDNVEQWGTLAITEQAQIAVSFTDQELTLSMDNFRKRVLEPQVSQMAATIDADVCSVYKDVYNSVGTPGTTPATALVMLAANQKLSEMGAPQTERYAAINPAANAALVNGMSGFFNAQDKIGSQFKKGLVSSGILGFDEINMTQSLPAHTTGTRTNGTVTTTLSTPGISVIDLSGLGANGTIRRGDVFTIGTTAAGVFATNPQTRTSTGSLQQFVVTADVTANGSGAATGVPISPAIYVGNHVLSTVDSYPVAAMAVTFVGAASTSYPQNLVYHKNAIILAMADLILPAGVDMGSRQNYNGMSMRFVRDYTIQDDRLPSRLDSLYGYLAVRPSFACRIWG